MHKIRIFLLSIIVVIAIVLVVLVYIVISFNNKDYHQLLTQAVDNFSDYTLTIKGSFALNRSLTPALSASEIELHAKTNASVIRIGKFRIQLSLAPLLENILLIAVVTLCPQMVSGSSVNQLCGNSQPVASPAYTALKDIADT